MFEKQLFSLSQAQQARVLSALHSLVQENLNALQAASKIIKDKNNVYFYRADRNKEFVFTKENKNFIIHMIKKR